MNAAWVNQSVAAPVQEWLLLFEKDPFTAVDDLLWSR